MKKALIISGGNIDFDFALCFLQEHSFTYLIAADKGLRFLNEAGICPTHIVGDFDSAGEVLVGEYENNPDVQIWRLNPIKDDTDTHEAMNLAIELGCEEITVLGCTGTRIDHVLGAVRDLRIPLSHHVKCILLDGNRNLPQKRRTVWKIHFSVWYGRRRSRPDSGRICLSAEKI